MTNPNAAMRMLITYVVIIPLAILVGCLLTDPMDYGTLGFLGIVLVLLASPIFIKWHYQILIFGLACPATCFFLPGKPPLAQAVVLISLGIAIIERTLSSEKRFISPPVVVWPLLFIGTMVYLTAELRGGIGFGSFGGDVGGGRKYLSIFIGIAGFFALTSRAIPRAKWKFFLALFLLPSVLGVLGDLFPYLGGPLRYLNLLFPPTLTMVEGMENSTGMTRWTLLSRAVGVVPIYLIARYGLRGIFLEGRLWRPALFVASFLLQLQGGYRSILIGSMLTLTLVFFMEGLHRTRLFPVILLGGVLGMTILATFSNQLPYTVQRSMAFLPLKWNSEVVLNAEGSSEWRYRIWRATWPKVPDYLLLGKGYVLTKEDYDMIGQGAFALAGASHVDASEEGLAISSDFHNGPLSTLMCFGVWGGIGIVWLMAATAFVVYRNYRYGDPALRTFNTYWLAACLSSIFAFFFIFGAFDGDVGNFARMAGFSIAMNGGLARRPARTKTNPLIKPSKPLPLPAGVAG